ncbi:MAG: hypothetical protein WC755_04180 [Candidatus Woesearchaeota archaeon]|jgi:hypothetical protein
MDKLPKLPSVNSGHISITDLDFLKEDSTFDYKQFGLKQRIYNYFKDKCNKYNKELLHLNDVGVALLFGVILGGNYFGLSDNNRKDIISKASQEKSAINLDVSDSEDLMSECIDTKNETFSDLFSKNKTALYVPVKRTISFSDVREIVKKAERRYKIKMGGAGPLASMLASYGNHFSLDKGDTLELRGKDLKRSLECELNSSNDYSNDMDALKSILIYKSKKFRNKKDSCNFLIKIKNGKYAIPASMSCDAVITGKISGIAKYCFDQDNYVVLYFDSASVGAVIFQPSFLVKKLTSVPNLKLTMMELFKREKEKGGYQIRNKKETEYIGRIWGIPLKKEKPSLVVLENNLSNPERTSLGYKDSLFKEYGFYRDNKRSNPKEGVGELNYPARIFQN